MAHFERNLLAALFFSALILGAFDFFLIRKSEVHLRLETRQVRDRP